jgi:hypothetical protein
MPPGRRSVVQCREVEVEQADRLTFPEDDILTG